MPVTFYLLCKSKWCANLLSINGQKWSLMLGVTCSIEDLFTKKNVGSLRQLSSKTQEENTGKITTFKRDTEKVTERQRHISLSFCWGSWEGWNISKKLAEFHVWQRVRLQVLFGMFGATARILKMYFFGEQTALCDSASWHSVSNIGPETSIYLRAQCLPVHFREMGTTGINKSKHVHFNLKI